MAGLLSALFYFGHAGDLTEFTSAGPPPPPSYVPTYYIYGF